MLSAMPTVAERRALLFVSGVLLLGVGVRGMAAVREQVAQGQGADARNRQALHRQIVAVDSARARQRSDATRQRRRRRTGGDSSAAAPEREGARAPARPSASATRIVGVMPGGPVDLDRASEWEIIALPRVGATLAHRIVTNRDSIGPFGSLDELRRVRGVTAAVIEAIEPDVTFSSPPRQSRADDQDSGTRSRAAARRLRKPRSP